MTGLRPQGQFASAAAAVAAARAIIEENLSLSLTAGLSAGKAYEAWRLYGDVPTIVAHGGAAPVEFDPFSFARVRAQELQARV
ncbi:MAG TPA: hypothetical protein VMG60_05650 [Burkholderiaceae bacterium]|nr:hypothetical protein [Burkholderiaceae bacterium]